MCGGQMGGMGVLFLGQQHEFEAGLKCKGCDHITTGLAPDHCCWRCMKQPGTHGPHCKRETVEAVPEEKEAEKVPVAEEQVVVVGEPVAMTKAEMKECTRMVKMAQKEEKQRAKEEKKREKEEKKREKKEAKAGALAGLPCKAEGCVFEASTRACAPGYCCKKCMKGKAEHGKNCAGKEFEVMMEVIEPVPVPTPVPVPVPVPAEEAVVVEEVVEEVPPPPAEVTPLEVVYAAQVASLRNMGFTVDDAMLASLEAHEGDLVKLINSML
eukprot:TRINITY_DN14809_c0_g2_i1.p2 TRINITY_DN14809_c0_g2~~TRINITY_DN14809_c0_g2_i1.p2  ORF type:complete len:313 (+),score=158.20 TRINITY_DN14809_c0_g2_i1:138-941(+)